MRCLNHVFKSSNLHSLSFIPTYTLAAFPCHLNYLITELSRTLFSVTISFHSKYCTFPVSPLITSSGKLVEIEEETTISLLLSGVELACVGRGERQIKAGGGEEQRICLKKEEKTVLFLNRTISKEIFMLFPGL